MLLQGSPLQLVLLKCVGFRGMVNQLAKFIPNISELSAPLRLLLGKNNS